MKTRIVAGLVASLVLVVSTGAVAGPKKHRGHGATRNASVVTSTEKTPSPHQAEVAKPAVAKPAVTKAAVTGATATKPAVAKPAVAKPAAAHPKKASGRSRFLASGVPLVEVRDGRLKAVGSAKRPCGLRAEWAKIGSLWTPLDAWGQVTSKSEAAIHERKLYEGSGCYEVSFQSGKETGDAGKLYVAKGSGYSPAPSAKWSPDTETAKRFERLYASQATAWVDAKSESAASHGKVLFFHLPKQEGSPEGAPTQRRAAHWAVAGGRVLLVGYVGANGSWKVGHVLPPNGKEHAYEPIAVLDMDGDGMPEIVVHEEAGGVFTDRVLSFDAGTMRWDRVVESPGGASR